MILIATKRMVCGQMGASLRGGGMDETTPTRRMAPTNDHTTKRARNEDGWGVDPKDRRAAAMLSVLGSVDWELEAAMGISRDMGSRLRR